MIKLDLRSFYFTAEEGSAKGFFFLTQNKNAAIVSFDKDIIENMTCGGWHEPLTTGNLRKQIREEYLKENDLSIFDYMKPKKLSEHEVRLGENNPLLHQALSKTKEVISDLELSEIESDPDYNVSKVEVDYVKNKTATIRLHLKNGEVMQAQVGHGLWVGATITEEKMFHMKQVVKYYLEKLQ